MPFDQNPTAPGRYCRSDQPAPPPTTNSLEAWMQERSAFGRPAPNQPNSVPTSNLALERAIILLLVWDTTIIRGKPQVRCSWRHLAEHQSGARTLLHTHISSDRLKCSCVVCAAELQSMTTATASDGQRKKLRPGAPSRDFRLGSLPRPLTR